MRKKLLLIPALALFLSCHKNSNTAGCGMQVCDAIFKQINVAFTDKAGNNVAVSDFSAVNEQTNQPLQTKIVSTLPVALTNVRLIADDSMRDQLSTNGDDVLVSAKNPATGEVKSVLFKISGGCNCHVAKVTGPDTIRFDQ